MINKKILFYVKMLLILIGISGTTIYAKDETLSLSSTNEFLAKLTTMYEAENRILLQIPEDSAVVIDLQFYSFEDGYLSLRGTLRGNPQSRCILKGTKNKMYGWIRIFAEQFEDGFVYTYTTNSKGIIEVQEATVSDILSIEPDVPACKKDVTKRAAKLDKTREQDATDLPDIVFIKPVPDNVNINSLQSKPTSEKVIWMDIRKLMDGDEPITYSRDDMIEMWQVVANGLSMYDVNVTTDLQVFSATAPQNRGIGLFHNRDGRSHCAYHGFGTENDCEIYLKSNGYYAGRSALHEFGHLLGLLDMGTGLNGVKWATYFGGYEELKWVPIMGNFLYSDDWGEETLLQWSNGDFKAGSAHGMPQEDALSIINEYIDIEPDDIVTSKPLQVIAGEVSMSENFGMINVTFDGYDDDDFTFEVTEPETEIDLVIDRIGHIGGSMLDVHAYLLDEDGTILIENNQLVGRYALIKSKLNPGKYTLRVAGGAEGTSEPAFPRYGSVGYYAISGTVAIDDQVSIHTKKSNYNKPNLSFVNRTITYDALNTNEQTEIAVFSLSGQELFTKQLHGSGQIDLGKHLGAGCYLLTLQSKSQNYIQPFTIKGK